MAEQPLAPDHLTVYSRLQADKPAVIDDRGDGAPAVIWSFSELERQANRLANVLLGLGVAPRDKIVWCGQNSLGVVRMMHAARKIGATAVPLNYRLSPEEAAYVIDNCDAVLVYADAEYADLMRKIRGDVPKLRHVLIFDGPGATDQLDVARLLAESSDAEPAAERAEASATMIYTSGTTGRPKGALRTAASDPQQQLALLQLFGCRPDDVYLTTGPLYHSGPGGFAVVAHALGNTVVLQRKFDPEDWLRLVARYRVTSTFSAPTPIRMICSLPASVKARYDRSSLRIMIANAAPWSYALKEAYLADFPEDSLFEVYGSTELGVNCVLEPKDQRRKPGSCGRPAPGVEIRLIDEEGRDVTEPHVPGELFVRSSATFETYYKAQEKYESSRRADFLTVGDIAYRDDEGYYYICDRKADMIISGGMNIYPAEIESALDRHPKIYDVAVIGIPSEEWGESVHAIVVPQPGEALSEAEVLAYAREHMASYKLPRSMSFVSEIPRNASGKILKRTLREPFWKAYSRQVS
jgi:acyl-CoA synthetase (AMP-forming)/AMP-acid ligase II